MKNTEMKAFGLKATEAQVVMIIMASVEAAPEHNYGQAFLVPFKTISTQFKYNYNVDAMSLKQVLQHLLEGNSIILVHVLALGAEGFKGDMKCSSIIVLCCSLHAFHDCHN